MPAVPAMPTAYASAPHPFFIESAPGRLFAVYHRPLGEPCNGNVLVVPPFNEEMNRCRSMVTRLAQAFAAEGFGTLVVDLYGTGESDGEHAQARWDIWRDNVHDTLTWLDAQPGGCSALLAIRLGAALAIEALQRNARPRALIAWQPVVDGKTYLTQFMRTRIAANMDRTDIAKETTASMRAQLAAGETIEVAGYAINPELAASIDALDLKRMIPPTHVQVAWFEKSAASAAPDEAAGEGELSPASARVLASWRDAGVRVTSGLFDEPAFWAQHHRMLAPGLLRMTADWLRPLPNQGQTR